MLPYTQQPAKLGFATGHAFRLGFVGAAWRVVTSADVTICFLGVSLGFYKQNRADRNVGSRFKKNPTLRFAF